MSSTENIKKEFLHIFFAQKKLIFRVMLLITCVALFVSIFWPKSYRSTGKVLLKVKKLEVGSDGAGSADARRLYPITTQDLISEIEILTSYEVVKLTVEMLHDVKINEDLSQKELKKYKSEIGKIKGHVKTEMIPGSNVIAVHYYNRNPKVASRVLDTMMKQYLSFRTRILNPVQEREFFIRQLSKYETSLDEKKSELLKMINEAGTSTPAQEINNNLSIKKDLDDQLNILISQALDNQLRIDYLDHLLQAEGAQHFSFVDNKVIDDHNMQLIGLHRERGDLLRTYLPSSAKVKLIDEQIEKEKSVLKTEVLAHQAYLRKELEFNQKKKEKLTQRTREIDMRNIELQGQKMDIGQLEREIELLQSSRETFYNRAEQAKINTSVSAGNIPLYISVLSRASASDFPVFPIPHLLILIGLITGFLTGSTLGFLKEFFDHTFKRPYDVENYAKLPIICSIPEMTEN